jgi:hypothetical protein
MPLDKRQLLKGGKIHPHFSQSTAHHTVNVTMYHYANQLRLKLFVFHCLSDCLDCCHDLV